MTTHNRLPRKVIRILIVDDHPTVCEGLQYRIASQRDMMVCDTAADVETALQLVQQHCPDVVVVDLFLRNSDGLELLKILKARHKNVRALVHSMYDESIYADRCLHAGAMGYINKQAEPSEVIKGIREVCAGRVYVSTAMANQVLGRMVNGNGLSSDPVSRLSDRQLEIFRLLGEGKTAAQIAECLHISVHTVETHRDNIKRKLGVTGLSNLIRQAVLWVADNR